jgi:regulator of protease activity HflC (stomatin/prohibitin superfamily)
MVVDVGIQLHGRNEPACANHTALLAERDRLNNDIQAILDKHTDPWGIKV